MIARIYRPARSAMQSGKAGTQVWHLEYEPTRKTIEPLMGWTAGDTQNQVRLTFETKEEAVAFARQNAIPYRVEEPAPVTRKIVSYSDNFKFTRVGQWTH